MQFVEKIRRKGASFSEGMKKKPNEFLEEMGGISHRLYEGVSRLEEEVDMSEGEKINESRRSDILESMNKVNEGMKNLFEGMGSGKYENQAERVTNDAGELVVDMTKVFSMIDDSGDEVGNLEMEDLIFEIKNAFLMHQEVIVDELGIEPWEELSNILKELDSAEDEDDFMSVFDRIDGWADANGVELKSE